MKLNAVRNGQDSTLARPLNADPSQPGIFLRKSHEFDAACLIQSHAAAPAFLTVSQFLTSSTMPATIAAIPSTIQVTGDANRLAFQAHCAAVTNPTTPVSPDRIGVNASILLDHWEMSGGLASFCASARSRVAPLASMVAWLASRVACAESSCA